MFGRVGCSLRAMKSCRRVQKKEVYRNTKKTVNKLSRFKVKKNMGMRHRVPTLSPLPVSP
jgi:hypothetical protein